MSVTAFIRPPGYFSLSDPAYLIIIILLCIFSCTSIFKDNNTVLLKFSVYILLRKPQIINKDIPMELGMLAEI